MDIRLAKLCTPPRLGDLTPLAIRLVMATRIRVSAERQGRPSLAILTARLGTREEALHAAHLVEVIGSAWPERFALSPPCCPALSPDEALLGAMTEAVEEGDRPSFDRAASDLLDSAARDQLWRELDMLCHGGRISARRA
jgi:hypothetical protein